MKEVLKGGQVKEVVVEAGAGEGGGRRDVAKAERHVRKREVVRVWE